MNLASPRLSFPVHLPQASPGVAERPDPRAYGPMRRTDPSELDLATGGATLDITQKTPTFALKFSKPLEPT